MLDGLYKIKFAQKDRTAGEGYVALLGDRALGGGNGYGYLGRVELRRGTYLRIAFEIRRHDPEARSVFGDIDTYRITVYGDLADNEGHLYGKIDGQGDTKLVVYFEKLAD
jgi:hypothetical protein